MQESGDHVYAGDCFAGHHAKPGTHIQRIPQGVCCLLVAELEQERTVLETVLLNGKVLRQNLVLTQDEILTLNVNPGDCVQLSGYYETSAEAAKRRDPWFRNAVLAQFLQRAI